MSKDVVFDEISCWYEPTKVIEDADARNGNAAINIEQQSQIMSGSGESPNSKSNACIVRLRSSGSSHGNLDSGAQVSRKGKKKVDPTPIFDVSCGHSNVDGESIGLEMRLNEELGIPLIVTLGARKSRNVADS